MRVSCRNGFTLIELSIVLVVIGLIAGGIMVGNHLIEAAAIRAQIRQLEQIKIALSVFKQKYDAIPGDIRVRAAQFGLTQGNSAGFRDNGLISDMGGQSPIVNSPYEPLYFFGHLQEAQLYVPDYMTGCAGYVWNGVTTITYPKLAFDASMGMVATSYNGGHWLYLGISNCASGYFNGQAGSADQNGTLLPSIAYAIDQKMDNSSPNSGQVLAFRSSGSGPVDRPDILANQCVTTVAATNYNIISTTKWCKLLIRAD